MINYKKEFERLLFYSQHAVEGVDVTHRRVERFAGLHLLLNILLEYPKRMQILGNLHKQRRVFAHKRSAQKQSRKIVLE